MIATLRMSLRTKFIVGFAIYRFSPSNTTSAIHKGLANKPRPRPLHSLPFSGKGKVMSKWMAAAAGLAVAAAPPAANAQTDTRTNSWRINTTVQKGHSPSAQINTYVSQIDSDVRQVYYTPSDVYVKSSDVPSHDVGPFAGNPAYPADQNSTW